jgi:dTDP-4-amino-4,6-dideoxygalactose transaminase
MKMNNLEDLELKLARMHQRKFCVATSRATSAIYLTLKSILPNGGKVVFPATLCASPINAALYASCTPIFCDVDYQDGNMSVKELQKILSNKAVDAIMFAHMYGNVADIEPLIKLAKKYNVFVIEDVCQAMGGSYKDKPLGSFGDASVLSFGHTKVLDIGYGGALLTDNEGLAKSVRFLESQLTISKSSYLAELLQEYRKSFYKIKELSDSSPRLYKLFYSFPEIFRDLYLQRCIPKKILKLNAVLNNLNYLVEERRRKAKIYENSLKHPDIRMQSIRDGSVPWRFNIYLSCQNSITKHLRNHKFDASNWYQGVFDLFEDRGNRDRYICSDKISSEVINLWLDNNTSEKTIKQSCNCIINYIINQ